MVFDCTIPAAHAEVDAKALMNGLHVLEEKPLAMSLIDAHRLIDLAEKKKLVHAVIQNRRFHPGSAENPAPVGSRSDRRNHDSEH